MERTRYRIEIGRRGLEAITDPNGSWEYHADAQATIAALQAGNRTYINERHEHMKQIEQLQARVQELEGVLSGDLELTKLRNAIIERYDMSANGLAMYKSVSGQLLKYPLSDGEFQGPLTPNEATE